MISGKIKFLDENSPTSIPLPTPLRSLTQAQPPLPSMPASSPQKLANGGAQGFAERTRVVLLPLQKMLVQPNGEHPNNPRKTVIRWHNAVNEVDVDLLIRRIIDQLKKER